MTHEQYVSLETAKLLKQAGFDWECQCYYTKLLYKLANRAKDKMELCTEDCYPKQNWNGEQWSSLERISAPTQAVAQRWLREVKDCHLWTLPYKNYVEKLVKEGKGKRGLKCDFVWNGTYHYDCIILTPDDEYECDNIPTYEAALEAGLQRCLTLLIEKL